jgi:hypothetical protein
MVPFLACNHRKTLVAVIFGEAKGPGLALLPMSAGLILHQQKQYIRIIYQF